jgi:hypothetical protein
MALRLAYTAVLAPAAIAAALAAGQIALAEATGVTTLDQQFIAGEDRILDVQMTLVAYFCATAVMLAATALPTGRRLRRLRPVAAATGALVALPLVTARANEYIGGLATDAVLAGAIVGAIAAFVFARTSNVAIGVAAHLALLWLVSLALMPFVDPVIVYAGLVQPLGSSTLDDLLGEALGYHLPTMLPYAVAAVLFTGLLGAWFARRGARAPADGSVRGQAVRAAVAAPLLAVVLYPVVGMDQWNGSAAPVVAGIALLGTLAAVVGASLGRRTAAPDAEPDRTGRVRSARPPQG